MAQWVKPLFRMPTSHGVLVQALDILLLAQLTDNTSWGPRDDVSSARSLPPLWKTHLKILAPSFSLAQPWLL